SGRRRRRRIPTSRATTRPTNTMTAVRRGFIEVPPPSTFSAVAAGRRRAQILQARLLPQPRLEQRLLARLRQLVEVRLHALLDPPLTRRDVAAEACDVGLARLESRMLSLLCVDDCGRARHEDSHEQERFHRQPPSVPVSDRGPRYRGRADQVARW